MALLEVENLRVSVDGKEIVKGLSLCISEGEVHVIMGQNGAGKSSLLCALAGHPKYRVEGTASFDGRNLLAMKPHERARAGLFLAFQQPVEVPGVSLSNFLRRAYAARFGREVSVSEFEGLMHEKMRGLGIGASFALRGVNEGFSGGEKKRSEMLQLALLEPRLAMLDEIDSGLDIDAVGSISSMLAVARKAGSAMLLVTHYPRILRAVKADRVHVMKEGRIIASGDERLAHKIEESGYSWVERNFGV